jgi:anti-sigma factor RsiW
MHEPVFTHLEEYLSGTLTGPDYDAVEGHLAGCSPCRHEVAELRELTGLFGAMRPEREFEAGPGFYGGVMNRVEAQAAGSFWNFFLDAGFARRLAYASVALVALVSTYWVSQPRDTEDVLASIQVPAPIQGVGVESMADQEPLADAQNASVQNGSFQNASVQNASVQNASMLSGGSPDPDADAILASLRIADE